MELKDKLLLGGAVICALIIFVVFAANKVNSDPNQFVGGAYYTPKQTTKIGINEGNSWSNFAAGNSLECVGLGNTTPDGTAVSMNGATKYKIIQYFPLTMEAMNINTSVVTLNTARDVLNPSDTAGCPIGASVACDVKPTHGDYYEIIAPFAFTFDCSNIDENRDVLTIISTNRQVRITFEGLANWFCAGPPGTETVYKNAGDDVTCKWEQHGQHHASIIGSSKNADKNGGSAGDLIGYASGSTTMTLQVVQNGAWVTTSWSGVLKN
ncbi:MAG: hypothetical protein NC131_13050 [Roseburia sp.]|nr:hypothetical protein [Roseburia sp.]